jgi:hypothetical protein
MRNFTNSAMNIVQDLYFQSLLTNQNMETERFYLPFLLEFFTYKRACTCFFFQIKMELYSIFPNYFPATY